MALISILLEDHFGDIPDVRREHGKKYPLKTILSLAGIGVLGGCNDWVAIAEFCRLRQAWLSELGLGKVMPSHDTFRYVFAKLNPGVFEECFMNWVNSLAALNMLGVVAIDGKVSRRSHDRKHEQSAIETVTACLGSTGFVLAQKTVAEGSNEIAAVPELLKLLVLKNCIVTTDAANCQAQNTQLIIEQGGDYVLALKENQATLHENTVLAFEHEDKNNFRGVEHETWTTRETNRGRKETREYTLLSEPDYIEHLNASGRWWQLGGIGRVRRTRVLEGVTQTETHYYITSLSSDVKRFANAVRGHWGIENRVHWPLDTVFQEDLARNRVGHQPANFAVLRRFVLNLLRLETTYKASLKNKRMRVAITPDYLRTVLSAAVTSN